MDHTLKDPVTISGSESALSKVVDLELHLLLVNLPWWCCSSNYPVPDLDLTGHRLTPIIDNPLGGLLILMLLSQESGSLSLTVLFTSSRAESYPFRYRNDSNTRPIPSLSSFVAILPV